MEIIEDKVFAVQLQAGYDLQPCFWKYHVKVNGGAILFKNAERDHAV